HFCRHRLHVQGVPVWLQPHFLRMVRNTQYLHRDGVVYCIGPTRRNHYGPPVNGYVVSSHVLPPVSVAVPTSSRSSPPRLHPSSASKPVRYPPCLVRESLRGG